MYETVPGKTCDQAVSYFADLQKKKEFRFQWYKAAEHIKVERVIKLVRKVMQDMMDLYDHYLQMEIRVIPARYCTEEMQLNNLFRLVSTDASIFLKEEDFPVEEEVEKRKKNKKAVRNSK